MAKKEKSESTRLYKLGEGATNFVDVTTGKKIVGNQKIEFTKADRRTDRFKKAVKNGHIEEVDEDEEEDDSEDPFADEKEKFAALSVAERKAFLKDEFEFDEKGEKEIDSLSGPNLIKKYAELLEDTDEDS
jgi:hypothetical protein